VSAVGHVTPYVVQNACGDKSCYYGARLHTSQNKHELARRLGNGLRHRHVYVRSR
jgi:hypothetical protein